MPGPNELSATLFIEITEPGRIRPELDRLVGIDERLARARRRTRARAASIAAQLEEDRISAVHYLRFALTPAQAARFAEAATPVALRVDHENYSARAVLGDEARRSLAVDLAGDPQPVHRFRALETAPELRVLLARGRARAVQVAADRIVIEAVPPAPPFATLPDDLAAELLALARELSLRWIREGRAPVVVLDPAAPHATLELRARR